MAESRREQAVIAALARNRGELDPLRLRALLERLGAAGAAAPAKP